MKYAIIIIIFAVLAWPMSYLYQLQLGAIPFLLLAIFFFVIMMRELKKGKTTKKREKNKPNKGSN